jgi:hypothetical protein
MVPPSSCPGTLRGTGSPIKWNLGYPVETFADELTQIKENWYTDPPVGLEGYRDREN